VPPFSKQLKKYREAKRMTQKDLALKLSEALGRKLEGDHIRSYEAGVNPKLDVIDAIATVLDIPHQYLFDDSPKTLKWLAEKEIEDHPEIYTERLKMACKREMKKIEVVNGHVGAGSHGDFGDISILDYIYVDVNTIRKGCRDKDIKAVRVIGDSMLPYLDNFDLALYVDIDEAYTPVDGRYVIEKSSGLMVKKLLFKANGNIVISSENSSYPDEELTAEEAFKFLDIVGIVVGRVLQS